MSGLMTRLARGLSAGMTSYGTSMLEDKRTKRLESIRKGERKEDKDFQRSESKLDRAARLKAAQQNASDSNRIRDKMFTPDEDGILTANFTFSQNGLQYKYNAELDKYFELNQGRTDEPDAPDEKEVEDEGVLKRFYDYFFGDDKEETTEAPKTPDANVPAPDYQPIAPDQDKFEPIPRTQPEYTPKIKKDVDTILGSSKDPKVLRNRIIQIMAEDDLPDDLREALRYELEHI